MAKWRAMVGLLLALATVLSLGTGALAAPAAQSSDGYVSGVAVQNLSSNLATVTIDFYHSDGRHAHTLQDTIPANTMKSWYLPAHVPQLPSGFVGSAVVSSDQEIVATVNTQNPTSSGSTPNDPIRIGTSSGVNQPSVSTTAYLPHVMKAYYGWNSYFSVENTSPSASTTVTVRYYSQSTGAEVAAASETATLNPNGSKIFTQSANGNLPAGAYSAVITAATQPVAVVCNFSNAASGSTSAQFQSYNSFSTGSTKLYAPRIVRRYYDYNTGLAIQNTSGSQTASVSVEYFFPGQASVVKQYSIAPMASRGIYLGDDTGNTSGLPNGRTGSAVITSNVPVVAIVNEDNRLAGLGSTYNAFIDGQQTSGVFFPQVTAKYYGYAGGVQVQNVGTGSASGTATFSMAGRTPISVAFTAAPNSSWSIFAPNVPGIGLDFNGAVSITANQPLVGIANSSFRSDVDSRFGQKYGDSATTYNGINLAR